MVPKVSKSDVPVEIDAVMPFEGLFEEVEKHLGKSFLVHPLSPFCPFSVTYCAAKLRLCQTPGAMQGRGQRNACTAGGALVQWADCSIDRWR